MDVNASRVNNMKIIFLVFVILLPLMALTQLYVDRKFTRRLRIVDGDLAEKLKPGLFKSSMSTGMGFQAFVFSKKYLLLDDVMLNEVGGWLRLVSILYIVNFFFVIVFGVLVAIR